MILVDTSIWIDHLHRTDPELVELLGDARIGQHPMVVGELELGSLADRDGVLSSLRLLPLLPEASHEEVSHLVEHRRLWGQGLSLVDVHLLASVMLAPQGRLWTRDRRLRAVAHEVGLAY